jgi:ATP-dependent RNA helicase RhlE
VRVLVATDIAARGIDVDGISHVVNYDFPMHAEDYVHRIGRTGRAQAIGDAISFISPEDAAALRSLEKFICRGLVRKRAEGFNYAASAPPRTEEPPRYRDPRSRNQNRPQPQKGDKPRHGGQPPARQNEDQRGQRPQKSQQRPRQQDANRDSKADQGKRSLWKRITGR